MLKVLGNKILRRIFQSKRDENGEWKGLTQEFNSYFYRSPNIARIIKSIRSR